MGKSSSGKLTHIADLFLRWGDKSGYQPILWGDQLPEYYFIWTVRSATYLEGSLHMYNIWGNTTIIASGLDWVSHARSRRWRNPPFFFVWGAFFDRGAMSFHRRGVFFMDSFGSQVFLLSTPMAKLWLGVQIAVSIPSPWWVSLQQSSRILLLFFCLQ